MSPTSPSCEENQDEPRPFAQCYRPAANRPPPHCPSQRTKRRSQSQPSPHSPPSPQQSISSILSSWTFSSPSWKVAQTTCLVIGVNSVKPQLPGSRLLINRFNEY